MIDKQFAELFLCAFAGSISGLGVLTAWFKFTEWLRRRARQRRMTELVKDLKARRR